MNTGELSDKAVVTADKIRKGYMAYFGLRGGSSSLKKDDKSPKKANKKSKRVKKKKGTKLKSKLKVKVAPTRKAEKAKIAVSRGKKKEIVLPFHGMNDMQFQIVTSLVYFISQRLINKVDFKQKVPLDERKLIPPSFSVFALLHITLKIFRAL